MNEISEVTVRFDTPIQETVNQAFLVKITYRTYPVGASTEKMFRLAVIKKFGEEINLEQRASRLREIQERENKEREEVQERENKEREEGKKQNLSHVKVASPFSNSNKSLMRGLSQKKL
ncbi:hypothetical protein AUR66_16570 [Haloferax profundi]|uniref:Uncharacterized protein n=2 Tax=Haloferax profundi TaxID=1544718 RepID=A0A0W1SFR5_9EURY|nr:hypothetical protein AUR66_16570 [Haloferax profundi]